MQLLDKSKKKLFVAYPWNIYIQSMYEDIFEKLFKEWDIRHGSKVTLESKDQSEVEEFMNRNKHLYDIFASAIAKSDFFIADITGTNPNVMLELGIAIQLNKNVLIVTNDELSKLPFDISSKRVSRYKDKKELIEIIKDELDIYNKIRSQTFEQHFEGFYFKFGSEGELTESKVLPLPVKNMKNLKFRCEYKFLGNSNSHDWFGIHLRAQGVGILRSELVYIRDNQKLECVTFPGQRAPVEANSKKHPELIKDDGFKTLEILITETALLATTAEQFLLDINIQNENLGGILLHAYAHYPPLKDNLRVRFRNIEIISLDTISPIGY